MKSNIHARSFLVLILGSATLAQAADIVAVDEAEFSKVVAPAARIVQLATGMKFTEGPQWMKTGGGHLIFSDIPSNELKQWSKSDGLKTFRSPSQQINGNTVDGEGLLISAEHAGRRVSRTAKDGTVTTVVDRFEGKKLNSPNDVIVKRDGTLWFTDPDYGLPNKPGTQSKEGKELPGNYVFRFDPKTKVLSALVKDFDKPNGLCFSPDEKTLYVADSGQPRHIRAFDVNPDGTLSNSRVYCKIDKGNPDGIRCDADGRVWSSAADGIQVFSTQGRLIGRILVPESPANLGFGGADNQTLFITARKSLYSVEVLVKGAR